MKGASWSYPAKGMAWSLFAGVVGAVGAFCVLLAFGAKGIAERRDVHRVRRRAGRQCRRGVVVHPPAVGLGGIRRPFFLRHPAGGSRWMLVTLYNPAAHRQRTGAGAGGSDDKMNPNRSGIEAEQLRRLRECWRPSFPRTVLHSEV